MSYWIYPNRQVDVDIEFLAHERELLTVSRTIYPTGNEEKDEAGKIWIPKGSYIDATGHVTVPTVTDSDVTFATPPVGILFSAVDVTYGPNYGALMIKGWVKGEYMNWQEKEWKVEYGEAVHKLLPGINFKDNQGNVVFGEGDSVSIAPFNNISGDRPIMPVPDKKKQ